jgi:predicted nucleotide-binding protein
MARLKVSRDDAQRVLDEQKIKGLTLLAEAPQVEQQSHYDAWTMKRRRWVKLTEAALEHIYTDNGPRDEFSGAFTHMLYVERSWQDDYRGDIENVTDGINILMSLVERLRYSEEPGSRPSVAKSPGQEGRPVVFLVHGHDEGTREKVARFLERAGPEGIEVVILQEQANKGRTVLEKLEDHAAGSTFAVVLITGDDIGGVRGSDKPHRPRARQNVIFEFGWFCGLIQRGRVAALHEPGVELPSDLDGLVYIPLDDRWQEQLARELTASGLDCSIDKLHRSVAPKR